MAAGRPKTETYSARQFVAVTPHASTELANPCRGLYIGGAGSVVVVGLDSDTEVTFAAVPAGTFLPIQVRRVDDSSTATSIVALY